MVAFLNECYARRETHPHTTLPQPLPSLKTTTLPTQKKTQPTVAEFQTLLANLKLSRPKILQTMTTPAPFTHTQSTTSVVHKLEETEANTQTQKDAPSENSGQPPLITTPQNPTTTQKQTQILRPTVAQPDSPPTLCRDHYRADPAPLPCVAVISPPLDGCDTGHRTITPSLHSVSTNPKLSSPAADLHLYCNVAQNPDEVHRSSNVVWFTGKGKGRIFLCLVPKPKTRGLALAREEKRTAFLYRWFKKRKKKRLKEKRRSFPWSKVGQKKKRAKVFILYCLIVFSKLQVSHSQQQEQKTKFLLGLFQPCLFFSAYIQQQVQE
jgi:hypothetical protein